MGMVPKSTKAEVKFIFGLSIQRVIICIIAMFASFSAAQQMISSTLIQIVISIASVIIALILTGKSPSNPKKNFAQGLLSFIFQLLEPKDLYGTDTDEYKEYMEYEVKRNENRKTKKGKEKKKDSAEPMP